MKHHKKIWKALQSVLFSSSLMGCFGFFLDSPTFPNLQANKNPGLRCQAWQRSFHEFHRSHQTGFVGKSSTQKCQKGWDMWPKGGYVYTLLYFYTFGTRLLFFGVSLVEWPFGVAKCISWWANFTYRTCIDMSESPWNHQDDPNNRSCYVFIGGFTVYSSHKNQMNSDMLMEY